MKAGRYRWYIVGVGVLVKAVGLGFGRFAYSILLPPMRTSLGFTYSQMGLLSGGILFGYLVFSFIGGILATRFGSKKVVMISLLCSALSMFSISRLSSFFPLLASTFAMGGAAAGIHISMTTLTMVWFEKHSLGRALGIVTGGSGFGIFLTGILVPQILARGGTEGWRLCWLLLAILTASVTLVGLFLLKEKPDREDDWVSNPRGAPHDLQNDLQTRKEHMSLRSIFLVYFIFGFSYIIYATYFVAFMVDEVHLSKNTAGQIWAIFGWMCMVSGLIWGTFSDRLGRRKALCWNTGIISSALLLPLLWQRPLCLGISTFLFGLTFIGAIAVFAALLGDQVGEKRASVYGMMTLIHGVGQFLGTTLGGALKDLTGSFQITLGSSFAGFILCLILIALAGKKMTSGHKIHCQN